MQPYDATCKMDTYGLALQSRNTADILVTTLFWRERLKWKESGWERRQKSMDNAPDTTKYGWLAGTVVGLLSIIKAWISRSKRERTQPLLLQNSEEWAQMKAAIERMAESIATLTMTSTEDLPAIKTRLALQEESIRRSRVEHTSIAEDVGRMREQMEGFSSEMNRFRRALKDQARAADTSM